jgi:hypothetical protein
MGDSMVSSRKNYNYFKILLRDTKRICRKLVVKNNTSFSMTIGVEELEKACNTVLDCIRKQEGEEITFEHNWFWSVLEQRHKIFEQNPPLGIGSIADAIEGMKDLVYKKYFPSSVHVEWLGQILIALSEKMHK